MPLLSDVIAIAAFLISIAAVVAAERLRKNIKEFASQQLKQGEESSIAANRSATAAETSAKAAEESAKIASQGMQLSQRAYLGTPAIEFISSIPSVNQSLVVKVIVKNLGNSPALNVRIADKMDFQPDIQTVPPAYPDNRQPGFDIPPGVEVPREYRLPGVVTQEQVNAIANDSKRLYVFGWARYNDIFGNEHSIKWCYEHSRFIVSKTFNIVPVYHKME